MSWAPALIICIFGPLVLVGAWCLVRDLWKHRNPVIRARPQPDARLYSQDKRVVKRWLS